MYHIKNDKRSLQSSEMIFSALIECLTHKAYPDITVTEIVQQAGLGRSTFYRNFDYIDDVLQWKCDLAFQGIETYLKENRVNQDESTQTILKPFFRYWYLHSFIIELTLQVGRSELISQSLEHMFELRATIWQEQNELIKNHHDYFVAIRKGAILSILEQWIKNKKNIPPDELAELVYEMVKISMHTPPFF